MGQQWQSGMCMGTALGLVGGVSVLGTMLGPWHAVRQWAEGVVGRQEAHGHRHGAQADIGEEG